MIKVISKEGDFVPMAHRISLQGGKCLTYIDCDTSKKMGDGIIDKVDSPTELDITPKDTVVFDMVGAGRQAEVLKSKGYTVVGGGDLNDKLELDRAFGSKFMLSHKIKIPPTVEFDDFDEAMEHVRAHPERYVFKPNGNLSTATTYVSQSAEDLLGAADYLKGLCNDEDCTFELQEFIEGIEMSTEGWFNGKHFLRPLNSTMEEKKLMPGGYGPNTGCMGNVVWTWDKDIDDYLYRTIFGPLESDLAKGGFVGPLDLNAIWTPEGPYGLEWTARFGYDAVQAMSLLLDMSVEEFLSTLTQMSSMPIHEDEQAMSVRVSIPPYPNCEKGKAPKVPIQGVTKARMKNVFLSDVMYSTESKMLYCAGSDGYVLSVAYAGQRLEKLIRQCYALVDSLEIPNKQVRDDIGSRVLRERHIIEDFCRNLAIK